MNRQQRRAAQRQARKAWSKEDFLDRQHLLEVSADDIEKATHDVPEEAVVFICDTRDKAARDIAKGAQDWSEERMRAWEAPFLLARMIPTVIVALKRNFAVQLIASLAPRTSELLKTMPLGAGRVVVTVSQQGVLMGMIPNGNSASEATKRGGGS